MADNLSPAQRKYCMSRIRNRGNKSTENKLVQIFQKNHLTGWRRQIKIFGNPDFVFPKHRLIVFVDGCFWHGCPKHLSEPATNRTFWQKKLNANKKRDRQVTYTLQKKGWKVLRIWQHDLVGKREKHCVRRIKRFLLPLH